MKPLLPFLILAASLLCSCSTVPLGPVEPVSATDSFRQITALHDSGKHRKALRELDAFAQQYPESPLKPAAQYYRASSLEALGEVEAARSLLQVVAEGEEGPWRDNARTRLQISE